MTSNSYNHKRLNILAHLQLLQLSQVSECVRSQVVALQVQSSQLGTIFGDRRQHLFTDVTSESYPFKSRHLSEELTDSLNRLRNFKLLIVAVEVQNLQLWKTQLAEWQKEVISLKEYGQLTELRTEVSVHGEGSLRVTVHVQTGDVRGHAAEVDLVQLKASVVLQVEVL